MKKVVLLSLLTLLLGVGAKASHNNGGEITYQWIGGNTYKVKMVLFVDCSSLMPDTIYFRSTSASCAVNRFDTLALSLREDASQVCDTMQTTCNGGSVPGQTKWVYEGNIVYSSCSDWVLSYSVCCRSAAPINVVSPNIRNFYIETIFDNTTIQNNNSPYFADNPRWLAPVNGSNLINAGAYDVDGDSLHFSLVATRDNGAAPIPFNAGYSASQPFGGMSTSINAQTGIIFTLAPTTGQILVGVRVDEFRDGQLLSTLYRDFITNVFVSSNTLPQITNLNLGAYELCTVDTLNLDIYSQDASDTIATVLLDHPYTGLGYTYSSPVSYLTDTNTLQWDLPSYGPQPNKDYIIYVNVEDEVCPTVKNVQSYAVVVSTSYCVWPGDANNDLTADIFDVLPIGVYNTSTGTTRPSATLNWEGQWSQNWGPKQVTGDDIKHVDCNGDGTINANDTTAILLNYNLTHLKRGNEQPEAGPNDPTLYVDITPDTIGTGAPLSIPIMLGTSAVPADSVYGVAMQISYDPTKIDSIAGITVDYSNSWLGTRGVDMIAIDTNFYDNGQIDIALVRTDGQMVSGGFGELLTLNVITIDNLSGKASTFGSLIVDFIDVKIIDINEMDRAFNQQLDSVVIEDVTSGVAGIAASSGAQLAPNPSAGLVQLFGNNLTNVSVEVLSITGQVIHQDKFVNGKGQLIDLSNQAKGIYFVNVRFEDNSIKIFKLILN